MSENSVSFLGIFFQNEDEEPAGCNARLDTRCRSGEGKSVELFSLIVKKTITLFHNFLAAFFSKCLCF